MGSFRLRQGYAGQVGRPDLVACEMWGPLFKPESPRVVAANASSGALPAAAYGYLFHFGDSEPRDLLLS